MAVNTTTSDLATFLPHIKSDENPYFTIQHHRLAIMTVKMLCQHDSYWSLVVRRIEGRRKMVIALFGTSPAISTFTSSLYSSYGKQNSLSRGSDYEITTM
jgi:hypothetical protein